VARRRLRGKVIPRAHLLSNSSCMVCNSIRSPPPFFVPLLHPSLFFSLPRPRGRSRRQERGYLLRFRSPLLRGRTFLHGEDKLRRPPERKKKNIKRKKERPKGSRSGIEEEIQTVLVLLSIWIAKTLLCRLIAHYRFLAKTRLSIWRTNCKLFFFFGYVTSFYLRQCTCLSILPYLALSFYSILCRRGELHIIKKKKKRKKPQQQNERTRNYHHWVFVKFFFLFFFSSIFYYYY